MGSLCSTKMIKLNGAMPLLKNILASALEEMRCNGLLILFASLDLFNIFLEGPQLMPPDYQTTSGNIDEQARKVADYIAGMTDRFALQEYKRIFLVEFPL